MEPIIRIDNIFKSYGTQNVLNGISLEITKGQVVSIIGSSGSGKSTLIRCINGIEKIDQGNIFIENKKMNYLTHDKELLKKIGFVFQGFNLFPHMSVIDNIINPCRVVRKISRDEAKELALSVLAKVKLSDKAYAYPNTLSGGERQRAAIARALAMEPEIILFDEPTSSLDPSLAYEVLETISELAKDGLTMLIVSHQINFIKKISDRIIFIDNGLISADGNSDDIFNTTSIENQKLSKFLMMVKESI